MRTVGAFEAKTNLSRLLDEVAAGETITITKNGVPVAELRPIEKRPTMTIEEAIAGILELRKHVRPDPGGPTVKEMIEQGRM
jgi:prevent-host-death family protein